MKLFKNSITISFLFIFAIMSSLAQSNEIKNRKLLKLTGPKVIKYLLKNNFDVKRALLDYKRTGTELIRYRGMYDYNFYGNGSYSRSENNNGLNPSIYGQAYSNVQGSTGISKKMFSGTTITTGITASKPAYEKYTATGTDLNLYQSGLNISVTQEILKNAFGINDRLQEQKIYNLRFTEREKIRSRLAGLIVDALIGYWNIAIADENLKTRKISLGSTVEIKRLIRKKTSLGLAEREELSDWSGRVLGEMSQKEIAEKSLFDSKLGMKRVLNLDSSVNFILGKTFRKTAPAVSFEIALKDAFLRRGDLKNIKTELKNYEIENRIAANNGLPSLKLKAAYGNNTYTEDDLSGTVSEYNPEYTLGFEFNYPIDGQTARAGKRDARIGFQSKAIELKQLESEIRDEVLSRVKQCDVDHRVYLQTKKSSEYARSYYNQVYKKFKRGRYSAVELKIALDSYILSRQSVLKSLVDYNISLLRRDLARNVIFQNFNIDIDSILKGVEN